MSRIGRLPVPVPAEITVSLLNGRLTMKNKKGQELVLDIHPNMNVEYDQAGKLIKVSRPDDERLNKSLHGLTRSLIANMVEGLTKGYEKKLKIEGIGYQAKIEGKSIKLMVGFAEPVTLTPPAGVTVEVPDPKEATTIIVKGFDKQKVGQFAAEIRASKKPEPYKGKGIRYDTEVIRKKEGKSFASGG
jgi:large subunit ribosomal protein L6